MKSSKLPFWPNPSNYRDIDLGLMRVIELLARVGNPHLQLPPTIHIAGTNGKGSTLAFLRSIFAEANLSVHCYTSPHLVSFNERIILSGRQISDEFLNHCLLQCKLAAEIEPKIKVTFFEGITVAAFLAFSKVKADILLLEVGMGGRLDATNVIPQVLASIIAPIDFDHTEFLGKTLQKIAYEKAGIIKENCLTIISKQKRIALKALEAQALRKNSAVKIFNCDWKIKRKKDSFVFEGFTKKINLPLPALVGKHQIENAATAIACILAQKKFAIKIAHIKSGIAKARWAARLQHITNGKFFSELVQKLNNEFALYVDGSHNPAGAKTVKEFLKSKKNDHEIYVIFAMLKDKNYQEFLRVVASNIDNLMITTIPEESKSQDVFEIEKYAKNLALKSSIVQDFSTAINQIAQRHKNNKKKALILIAGSLYLAGNFLELNGD